MSLDAIGRALSGALEIIGGQGSVLAGARSAIENAHRRLRSVAPGSRQPLLPRAVTSLRIAADRLEEGEGLLAEAVADLVEYAQAIGVQVSAGGSAPVSSPWPAAATIPAQVQRLADRMKPWQPGEDTIGYAFDFTRRHLDNEQFVSGRDASAADGLAGRYRLIRTFTDHVEGHVAARMRRPGGPREVVLVMNNEPCKYRAGCDRLLRDILPVGATLTVYVKDERGLRLYDVFEGNGKGIAP